MTNKDAAGKVAARERLFAADLATVLEVPIGAIAGSGRSPQRAGWLAAALVVLGVFVAGGVAWLRAREGATSAQEPAAFDPVFPWYERHELWTMVAGAATLADLPAVPAVYMFLEDDPTLAFLERQRDLRDLMLGTRAGTGITLAPTAVQAIAALPGLTSLEITDTVRATADELRGLRMAPKLEVLRLHGPQFRLDASLAAALVELPKLRLLQTSRVEITAEGLEALAGLPHLEVLQLGEIHLDDVVIAAIAKLRTLRVLGIRGDGQRYGPKPMARISARHMQVFASLPRLVSLSFDSCDVDDEALAGLPPNVQALGLGELDGVTAAGLRSVAMLPQLRALSFERARDDDLEKLARSVWLMRRLRLERFESRSAFPSKGVWAALEQNATLRSLSVRCPEDGVPKLAGCAKMLALEQVTLWFPKALAPVDLEPLKGLPRLRSVLVVGSGLSVEQRAALGNCLAPNVTVTML